MANIRECWICGKQYSFCPKCQRVDSWRALACSPRHFQIHETLREYRERIITKDEAKRLFDNIGINDSYEFEGILPSVARDIKNIIDYRKVTLQKENDEVVEDAELSDNAFVTKKKKK